MVDQPRDRDAPVAPTSVERFEAPSDSNSARLLATSPRHRRRKRDWFLLAGVVVGAIAGLSICLIGQIWTGTNQSPLAAQILRIQIIGGIAQAAVYVGAVSGVVFLALRRPTKRRLIAAGIGIGAGALAATSILVVVSATNVLGVALSPVSTTWIVAGFAAIGLGIASFFTSSGWRNVGVGGSIVLFLLAGTLGVNADFGLDPTIGDLAGISTQQTITLPLVTATPAPVATPLDGGALWANWSPPPGMPRGGQVSSVVIPGTISGFRARPAGLYLPPAALASDAPALPLVIMMMGQPGNPDPTFQAQVLDQFAIRHDGLAPIVLIADQIGNPADDPLCTDGTRYGKAETYITQDVVNWARTHLHVLQDPAHWTIAGYSNGGECALSFGAQFPQVWGNVIDISGEEYPGSDHAAATLSSDFHGDRAAYEATWPTNILATGTYPDTVGIFTVSSNDGEYLPQAKAVYAAATAAHWKTTLYEVPNGGHVLGALIGGLTEGYTVLYPRLGLSQPGTTP